VDDAAGDADSGEPPRPHPGPPSKLARNAVIATLIAFVVASNIGTLFLSVLVTDHPAVFIALNPINRNLALASGSLSAASFYVIGFLRLIGPDPLFFLLGRWYGDGAIRWVERKSPTYGDLLRRVEKWFDKARMPIVAFAPNNYICLFAGAAGMGWGAFWLANVVGTVIRLMLIRFFSKVFEGSLGSVRLFIAHYRWPLLIVSFAAVGISLWFDQRRGGTIAGGLTTIEEDIAAHEAPEAD
jgi:membrane protein DedA with SNARE-associated domain